MSRFWIERLANDRDLDGVLEVEAESFTNPWTREMYVSELQRPSACHVLVLRTETFPVAGFCAFWLVCDEIHINNLAIRPGLRGQGLGSALIREVLARAEELGAGKATLEVRASNTGAQRLYERVGFVHEGTRRGYYTHPVEDALIYWWHRGRAPG